MATENLRVVAVLERAHARGESGGSRARTQCRARLLFDFKSRRATPSAVRDSVSGNDGNATVPALPLTGTYTVTVSKEGFSNEERKEISLRSGETATLKVNLLVGSGKSEVTVYGTTEGVRPRNFH